MAALACSGIQVRKVDFFLLNYASKTCLGGLKVSENSEIEHVFQSKAFFISLSISTQVASAFLRSERQT